MHLLRSAPEHCGSLYDAIAFKRFRGCIFVVTLRSWKGNTFYEELFNEYAEIHVNGIVSDNFDRFVRRYCNATNANNVKHILKTNLINLRPMFRNPLFVIMICELVVNNVKIDNYSLTLTNLLQKVCEYLFQSFTAKPSAARVDNIRGNGVEKYLVGIGEIASNNNLTYIEAANEKLSSEQNEFLNVGISIGLISTSQRYDKTHGQLYFFHDLLRDFCQAKYYHHLLNVKDPSRLLFNEETKALYYSILTKSLPWKAHVKSVFRRLSLKEGTKEDMHNDNSDNHDTSNNSFLNYFTIFLCAFDMFDAVVFRTIDIASHVCSGPLAILDFIENKLCYSRLSFLSQCLYESRYLDLHIPLDAPLITPMFLQNRCIVLDMSIVNSHAATEYILSSVSKIKSLVPQEFVVIGDTFTSKSQASTSERCGSPSINDDLTTLFQIGLEREVLFDLLFKCRFITTLKLMNLKITCHTEKLDDIKNLSKIESVAILNVGSIASAKYLLNLVSCNLEHVQKLYLINVRVSMYMEQKSDLRFQDIFFLLCDIAYGARTMILPGVNNINKLVVSPERIDSINLLHLHELYLGNSVEYIIYHQLLTKLIYCPNLEQIILEACCIDFNIDTTSSVLGPIRRSSAKLFLKIDTCQNEILFANVMLILSKFYPGIRDLTLGLHHSQVKFEDFHPSITITAKCQTILYDCTCTVIVAEKSQFEEKLGDVSFLKCTLNKNKSHNISDFIQWFQNFFIIHGGVYYVWMHHGKRMYGDQIRLIYTPHVCIMDYRHTVDIHNVVTTLEEWVPISSLIQIYFYTEHVPSLTDDKLTSLKRPRGMSYSQLNEMRFGESDKYINCQKFLTKLVSCPHLAKIVFEECSIDFGVHTSEWTDSESTAGSARELHIEIKKCKNEIIFANLIIILSTLFPAISNGLLALHNSNVKFATFHSTVIRSKLEVYLNNCICTVIESDLSPFEKKLECVQLSECTLTRSSSISGVLQCCEKLWFHIKNNIRMLMCYEEHSEGDKSELMFSPFIVCTDGTAVDIQDVTNFLQKWNPWIPISSIKGLKFNTVLDLPLDDDKLAAVKACAMIVDTIVFEQCSANVDIIQHLMALRTCFTSLSRFVVFKCNLSFAHTQVERRLPLAKSMMETHTTKMNILIHECKHVKLSDTLLLGLYANVNAISITKFFEDCNLLADVSTGRMKTMRYSNINEFHLAGSEERINCEQLLTKLLSCPNIAKIILTECHIDFIINTSEWRDDESTGSSARELSIVIDKCKSEILFANLIFILSTFSPIISNCLLALDHSNVKFTRFLSNTVIRSKHAVSLNNCICTVIESDVSHFKERLQRIDLLECKLTRSSSISGILQCCEYLFLYIKKYIRVLLFYVEQSKGYKSELVFRPLIQCTDMNTVDIHDITSFLQKWNHWIPISSIKLLSFNTVLDLPLDDDKLAAVKACGMNADIIIAFVQCTSNVDIIQHLMALRTCFTSLSGFVVVKCNLSFAHTQEVRRTDSQGFSLVESMIKTQLNKICIRIEECKPVTVSDMLMLIQLLSPNVTLSCSGFYKKHGH